MKSTRRGVLHSIGNQATLVVITLLIVTGLIGAGLSMMRFLDLAERNVEYTYDLVLSHSKEAIRNHTYLPFQVVRRHANLVQESGLQGDALKALEQERKAMALNELKAMRLPDGNYFWVNDMSQPVPHMIMHPTNPALDGKLLDNPKFNCAFKMQAGVGGKPVELDDENLFVAMVQVAGEAGEGFVWYEWSKPTEDGGATEELFPKLSYVVLYEPWGWVIGNGIYIDDIKTTVDERQQVFAQHIRELILELAIVSLTLLLIIAVGMLLYFRRLITRPLGNLVAFSEEVASGRLDARLEGRYPGETGDLKESMEVMVGALNNAVQDAEEKGRLAEEEADRAKKALAEARQAEERAMQARREGLREAAGKLENLVATLQEAAGDLSSRVDDANRAAMDQREQAGEASTSMSEMNSAVMDVAHNASNASNSADAAREKAGSGKAVVSEVVASIHTVSETTNAMEASLHELAEQAEAIGRVMSVINDIADQTNLLALNAAIEAARAGEAGKGFAVVADEVRKLAEKTMQATDEVGKAVSSIQSGVSGAGRQMDESATAVERSSDLAEQAGTALEDIVRMVDEASDQVRAIAAAAEEQSASSETINRTMDSVRDLSSKTAQNMDEAVDAIEKLTNLASQLTELMESLRKG